MAHRRLILDTDGGVDDAQALLLLIAAGRTPWAITTVFGNVSLAAATTNVLAVLAVAGTAVPVHAGADRPLVGELIDARHVHGEDGLGGAPRPPHSDQPAGSDAVEFLVATLLQAAADRDPVDLLMIGPLSNLALALRRAPGIAAGIGQLIVMGGTLHGRGNVTPAAEFNIFADPEAAAIVLGAGLDTTVVPWEPCVAHDLEGVEVDRLFGQATDGAYKAFARALADHDRRRHVHHGHGDRLFFIDPFAAAVAVEPAIVTRSLRASLGVGLAPGLTRGMTIVDPSGRLGTPPVTLVEEARRDRLTALYAASVVYLPQTR
ncbi:MAG: nucleoside hydrolase [Alphaproteobacteria bacterium]|nr:nucleoside hydrolase [Alphaproteobacteria bacterium]